MMALKNHKMEGCGRGGKAPIQFIIGSITFSYHLSYHRPSHHPYQHLTTKVPILVPTILTWRKKAKLGPSVVDQIEFDVSPASKQLPFSVAPRVTVVLVFRHCK